MADDHWLSAMSKCTGDQLTERNGDFVGGAPALAGSSRSWCAKIRPASPLW